MSITFVIFDMDQVLYDYEHEVRLTALEQFAGRPRAEIHEAIWGCGFEESAEAGDPATAEAYLAEYARRLGCPIDRETWIGIRKAMMRPRPQVLALASRVAENADVALLTNNGMMLKEALPHCAPEAFEIFGETAHVSAEFGLRKPDPEIYRRICARYGHPPGATLFIDDNESNIAGAGAAGLKTHLFRDIAGLKAALDRLGLLD